MIHYKRGHANFMVNVLLCRGSVFPRACAASIPGSIMTAVLVYFVYETEHLNFLSEPDAVMSNNAIWSGFTFLVGFLVVFRTSNAYSRFWEGCTSAHKMGAEWFDCCSALMAFCRSSKAESEKVLAFKNTLVRLFSILHAVALGEIEDCGETHKYSDVEAFKMELIDCQSIDERSMRTIRDTEEKVELLFMWIQELIVSNMENQVLCIAPPILTRSFQELARGMVHYHDALRLSKVPFPFPYAVTCDSLLVLHYLVGPFIVSQWCKHWFWSFVFSFIQIFTLWSLNMIAVEMENPFGHDPNDLDGNHMHVQMNKHFRLLLRTSTNIVPTLHLRPGENQMDLARRVIQEPLDPKQSLFETWEAMEDDPLNRHCSPRKDSSDTGASWDVKLFSFGDGERKEGETSPLRETSEPAAQKNVAGWEPCSLGKSLQNVGGSSAITGGGSSNSTAAQSQLQPQLQSQSQSGQTPYAQGDLREVATQGMPGGALLQTQKPESSAASSSFAKQSVNSDRPEANASLAVASIARQKLEGKRVNVGSANGHGHTSSPGQGIMELTGPWRKAGTKRLTTL